MGLGHTSNLRVPCIMQLSLKVCCDKGTQVGKDDSLVLLCPHGPWAQDTRAYGRVFLLQRLSNFVGPVTPRPLSCGAPSASHRASPEEAALGKVGQMTVRPPRCDLFP